LARRRRADDGVSAEPRAGPTPKNGGSFKFSL
jgi:hypothetical protein